MAETSQNNTETQENSISEEFSALWAKLNHNQRRFAVAMLECDSKRDGAEAVGIRPDTVYRWPAEVDRVVELLIEDAKRTAVDMLTAALSKAVMVKIAGLDSGDDKLRQDVATEIIDRAVGKATQRIEATGKDGGPIETKDADGESKTRSLAALADALAAISGVGADE